ncbi:pyridoxamine 5'-phosphate oxidase family protein [Eudoraea sp.]|uniref:pyridoxamine 5'-phosphate oxidase family protein n=2 Tax=Eudoraea sp. TaxID=1979955 RepID=UPI003C712358
MKPMERTDQIFKDLKEELKKGSTQKSHPFRYFTLGTVGLDRLTRQRTLVLRKVSDELLLSFYTDFRSKKIIHIKENNKVGVLFYNPEKLLQIKIEGIATIIKGKAIEETYNNGVPEKARKGYTTAMAPGTPLEDPAVIEYLKKENHFCVVEITPFKIEYLKLQEPEHLRVRFSKRQELWSGEFLVP